MPEIGNTAIFRQTDANNNSGSVPTWAEGMAPSQVNDSARALQGAVTREWNWRNATLTSTGSSNAYVLTYSVAPAAYYNGQNFAFITSFANTGSATVNVNGLGATTVKKIVAGAATNLASGEWPAGEFVVLAYNVSASAFIWMNRGALDSVAALDTANTFTASQVIQIASASASAGPLVTLDRNSASPAVNDDIGAIVCKGRDSGGNETTYAQFGGRIVDTTNGAEYGSAYVNTLRSGVETAIMRWAQGAYMDGADGGDKGLDTFNAKDFYSGGFVLPRRIWKTANEIVTASTTVQNDDELFFDISDSAAYWFKFVIFYTTPAAADFKWDLFSTGAGPPGTIHISYTGILPGGGVSAGTENAHATAVSLVGATDIEGTLTVEGTIYLGASQAGQWRFRFAQDTSNAGNTTVRRGSYVEYTAIP